MALSVFDSAHFKRLQAEWYQRLKDSGFEDSEANGRLNEVDPRTVRHALATRLEREAYNDWAWGVYWSFEFSCEAEKLMWEQHAMGLSMSEIGKLTDTPTATVKWKIKQVRIKAKL